MTQSTLTETEHSAIIPGMAYLFRSISVIGGKRYRSKKWYGKWKTPSERWMSKSLSEDKKTARKMLMKLCTSDELESVGIVHRKESIFKLLERFRQSIASSSTPAYARLINHRASAVLKEINATHPEHIEPAKVKMAVAKLADSLRTRNHYTAAIKQLCRWLVDNGHAKRNPVAELKPAKHEADKRYVRRALSKDEWEVLSKATINSSDSFRGLNGKDRFILYLVVLSTGWRAGGLAQLQVRDFKLDGLVVLEAKHSKNRREQRKFLPDSVRKTVADYLQDKPENDLVWPGTWAQDAAEMLRVDLEAARIPHVTDEGIMDFHAFRNTSITWLLESGTPIYLVQKHADHASPAQTMRYARPKRDNLDDAVELTFSHIISHKSTPVNKVSERAISAIMPNKRLKTKKAHGRSPVGQRKKKA